MTLTLGDVSLVLTGDAEAEVWSQISTQIPENTVFFKLPHHGSSDAMFSAGGETPWLDEVPRSAQLGISSHVRPFSHPDPRVVALLNDLGASYYRTDHHYHITVETDRTGPASVKYSHV